MDASYAGYDGDYEFYNIMRPWLADKQAYAFYGWAGTSGTDIDDDETLDNTWTDLNAEAVDGAYKNGDGFWVKAEKAGAITLLGEVNTAPVTFDLVAGWNLVANPYPIDIPVTNFGKLDDAQPGYDEDYEFSCILRPWLADKQAYAFYGWAGTSGTDIDDDETLDNTWTDLNAEATDAVIKAGESVWIKVPKAGTISFTYPVAE